MTNTKKKTVPAPRLRFPGFEGEWEEKKLGEILSESRIKANDELGKRLTVSLHLKGVSIRPDHEKSDIGKTVYYRRKAGQFIYGKQNIFRGSLGIIPDELDGYLSSQDLPAFDISHDHDPLFIYNYFARPKFYESLEKVAIGTGSKRVHPETIYGLTLAFPTLPEQTRIAAALSSLDAVITAHQSKLEALRQHKRGLMAGLFPAEGEKVPRLRFPEFEGSGEWKEKKLGEAIKQIASGRSKACLDGLYNLYGSTGIIGKTNDNDYVGTFINIARVGANAGYMQIVTEEFGATDNTLVMSLSENYNYGFIFSYLGYLNLNRLVFGSGQPLITGKALKDLQILVPSLPEQQRIAACLSSLDDLMTAQQGKIAALQEFKRGLMQGLFPRGSEG